MKIKKNKPTLSPEKVPDHRLRTLGEGCPHCGGSLIGMRRDERRAASLKYGRKITKGAICTKCKTEFLPVPGKFKTVKEEEE